MAHTGPIRVLVADDEPLARRGIRQLLTPHRDMIVAGESRNGPETLRALQVLKPDLLFLDIQMPEMNGFEVLRACKTSSMPEVVFVTAHDHFAVRAFEAHALDYLVKPVGITRFDAALERVRERLRLSKAAQQAAGLATLLEAELKHREKRGIDRLLVTAGRSDLVIPVEEIDWIEAKGYYSAVHVAMHSYLLRESLLSLESRLDPRHFARVHRGAIVRLDRVQEVRTRTIGEELLLRDGSRVPVSRRRRAALNRFLSS